MSDTCPTKGGLGENGFNPDYDLKDLIMDPGHSMHIWGWLASGFLVLCTVTISSHAINEHLEHYISPKIQRHKVRVLAYPSFYAVLAWLSYLAYNYETVIMFFASFFESFAVYNLYSCFQAYLEPFREKSQGEKVPIETKVLGIYKLKLKSKWGLHFRVIMDILVLQFPIWNIISAVISILTQVKGVYCDGQFDFKGAYIYLVVIQFISLSLILMALFTYLSVFNDEWKEGGIPAHQQFWCVKAPIMIVFYFGDVLLTALVHFKVITDRPAENGGTHWTAEAIKNGYYVLLVCTCMLVVSILMQVYFGVNDKEYLVDEAEHNYFEAFTDSFLAYIPQFLKSLFYCGGDTVTLAKKRIKLKKDRRLSDDEHNLLTPNNDDDDFGSSQSFFRYSMRSDFDHKLRDDDDHRSSGHFNFNALPLEPLSISNINYRDHISMPPPPRTDRTLRRKDESTQELTTRNSHFTPHD